MSTPVTTHPCCSEQPREAACAGAEISYTRARTRDASRGEAIEQLGRKPRAVTRVVRSGAGEIGGASGHSDAQHKAGERYATRKHEGERPIKKTRFRAA